MAGLEPALEVSGLVSIGETYRDLGADSFANRDPERQIKRLVNSWNATDTTSRFTAQAAAA